MQIKEARALPQPIDDMGSPRLHRVPSPCAIIATRGFAIYPLRRGLLLVEGLLERDQAMLGASSLAQLAVVAQLYIELT